MDFQPLPSEIQLLLHNVGASPRLVAHLTLVHDAALKITHGLAHHWPSLTYDKEAVLMGAATHDIGKIIFPDELTGPGHRHEAVGAGLLLDSGLPEHQTRFTRTHGQWGQDPEVLLEDLLVALADALWKGQRDEGLEEKICQTIGRMREEATWRVSIKFYDLAEDVAHGADDRIRWQERHAV